jgi:integrase
MTKVGATLHPKSLVFVGTQSQPLRRSNFLRRQWRPLLVRAGVEYRPFKSCRSTSATLAAKADVNPKVVQVQLGHAKLETTLSFYTAIDLDQQVQAASAVEAALA